MRSFKFYCKLFIVIFCVSVFAFNLVQAEEIAETTYDIVIKNGRIIDPETERDETGVNIGIKGKEIVKITRDNLTGKRIIDAEGLVIVPGFIDPLSYDPNPIGVWYKLADGVTTSLALHGGSVSPESYFKKYDKLDPPLNYGTAFFVAKMRSRMEPNRYNSLTEKEIERLVTAAEKALNEGAMAISFSLEYYPGTNKEEILPLMKLAKEYNVPVFFHLRYSTMYGDGGNNIDGINEVLDYARATGAAIHIDHINSTGGTFSMEESLALIRNAKDEGLDITVCTYPYNFWATRLSSARFDKDWQERFKISYEDLQLIGHQERLNKESFKKYRGIYGVLAAAYAMPEEDIVRSIKEDYVMIGSDGMIEADPFGGAPGMNNHPRGAGNFSRVIASYVRDQQDISLMTAIKKMTLLPAQMLEAQVPALQKKGRLQEGMDADIVIFDYNEIQDKADVLNPAQYSEGIHYVLVNGQIVMDEDGIHKDVRAGKAIKAVFEDKAD